MGSARTSDETSPKVVTADCAVGKSVLGGGYIVDAATGDVAKVTVSWDYPSDGDTWTVAAGENDDDDVGNWSIQAFALCATAP
jgi:hypothetical protein